MKRGYLKFMTPAPGIEPGSPEGPKDQTTLDAEKKGAEDMPDY